MRLTRRHALGAGAAALAASVLRRPSPARAVAPDVFELAVDRELSRAAAAAAGGWRATRPLPAPARFDLLGLRWRAGGSLEAQARVRRGRGAWSRWHTLPRAYAHAPDGEAAPAGSEPAYVGAADTFQLRWRGDARDVRVRFVRARAQARAAQVPSPATGAPPIIPRELWGAAAVPTRGTPQYGTVQMAFVHHTAGRDDYGPEESAAIVLAIARYHVGSNGWNDIGYNFVVDRHGQIFEARAGGVDQPVIGAQAQGYNASSTGIACLGTFTSSPQGEAGLAALARLIAWKLSLHGVPVLGQVTITSAGGPSNRFPAGTPVTFERVSGHRDGDNTSCPGDALYAQLAEVRARAAGLAGPLAGLTLRASSTRLRHPTPVVVSGTLLLTGGAPAPGATLDIQFRPQQGGEWRSMARAVTAADGTWSAGLPLPSSGAVRSIYAGVTPPLESPVAGVWVLPRVSLEPLRRVRRGRAVTVEGVVEPAPVGRVTLTLERRAGSRWVLERRRSLPPADGTFTVRLRPRRAGLYRVTAAVDGVHRSRLLRVTAR